MPSKPKPGRLFWNSVSLMTLLVALLGGESAVAQSSRPSRGLQLELQSRLPALGHRNWIVVADAAYPAQSREGIETIYVGGDQAAAVAEVLQLVDRAPHVKGVVYLDKELKSVPEKDAPGVEAYRRELDRLLDKQTVQSAPHEEIIAKLDEAAKTFRVVIFKTRCTIPYTSVFIELDCGYWGPEQEQRLRAAMGEDAGH